MRRLTYQRASWPDEDELVAELMMDGEYVAHVLRRGGALQLTIYPRTAEVRFNVTSLVRTLTEIPARLAGGGGRSN
jgi:hypothetical protein